MGLMLGPPGREKGTGVKGGIVINIVKRSIRGKKSVDMEKPWVFFLGERKTARRLQDRYSPSPKEFGLEKKKTVPYGGGIRSNSGGESGSWRRQIGRKANSEGEEDDHKELLFS